MNATTISKEYCWDNPLYFKELLLAQNLSKVIIDSCMKVEQLYWEQAVFQPRHRKYIFVVRYLPSRLWSGFNYWCIPLLDKGCLCHDVYSCQWIAQIQSPVYRSPELFHEFIIGSMQKKIFLSLHQ